MTLFGWADPPNAVFREALGRYFAGEEDARTVALLDDASRPGAPRPAAAPSGYASGAAATDR